jgi:hypothetical protein
VQKGDEGTAVSYAEIMKAIEVSSADNVEKIVKKFPAVVPVDEVYLKRKDIAAPKEKPPVKDKESEVPVRTILWTALGIVGGIILFLLVLPGLVLRYYLLRYRNANVDGAKPYWAFRAATYYLHMVGLPRGSQTPMQYAREVVDPILGTSFVGFMNVYLKKKYAKQELNVTEQAVVNSFLHPFLTTARGKISFATRVGGFMNPVRCASFFVMPEEEGEV